MVVRGEFCLDFDFVDNWGKELKRMNDGKVGKPFSFPDSFMKWQAIWHQWVDYRGLEGIARKLAKFGLIPEYDDYTTIWHRIHNLKPEIELPDYDELEIGCDGSGLKTNNAGQYRIYKYGERTRKKHLVVIITGDVRHKKLLDIEAYVKENNGYFAYCDTDALFVNPELVSKIQAFFKPLNPYTTHTEMFKVESDEDGKPLDNVWFYGIFAKRYCLYNIKDDKIDILKHSSHGLWGLIGISEDEAKNIWKDILDHHYNRPSKGAIENKYSNKFVMGKLALTSPFVLQRFRRTNKDKRLKPFNFVIVGIGHKLDQSTKEPIIPIMAYTKNTDIVPFNHFTDYKTGKEYTDKT